MEAYQIQSSTNPSDLEKLVNIAKSFGGNTDDIKSIRSYIKNELKELGDNRILYLISSKDEGTIGSVQLLLKNADEDPELANGTTTGHIHALQIDKRHHRKGLGTKLMDNLEKDAKVRGMTRLTLGVDDDNPKAIALYEKLNYKMLKTCEGREEGSQLFYLYKNI